MNEPNGPRGEGGGGPSPHGEFQHHRRRKRRRSHEGGPQGGGQQGGGHIGGGHIGGQSWRQGGQLQARRQPHPRDVESYRDGPPGRRQNLPALLALLLAVACLLVCAVMIFLPFLPALVGALVLTVTAYPMFEWILEKVGERRRGVASALACLALLILVFAPLVWLGWSLARELPNSEDLKSRRTWLADRIENVKVPSVFQSSWGSFVKAALPVLRAKGEAKDAKDAKEPANDAVDEHSFDVGKSIITAITNFIPSAASALKSVISAGFQAILLVLLTLFLLFFFFKDGQPILRSIQTKIPLDRSQQDRVVRAFSQVSRSIIRGTVGTAFAQGAIAGVAYAILGLPAIFLGALTTFCALVPPFGTSLITLPLVVYLAFLAEPTRGWAALFLLTIAIGISLLDNILRPLLMRGSGLQIHSIWLFLAILGGMSAFGPMGLIYGPLVLVLLGAFLALLMKEERDEAARVHTRQRAPPKEPAGTATELPQPAPATLPSPAVPSRTVPSPAVPVPVRPGDAPAQGSS